jgi:hypothetical protein
MNAAQELSEPLKIEMDPFAAAAGGPHLGRPLQAAFREVIRHIVRQTPVVLVTGDASTGKTLLVDMTARTCSEMGLSVERVDRGDLVHMTRGQQVDVLLVDEANSIPDSMLDALLAEGDKKAATTTVFLGLPSCVNGFAFSDVHPVIVELTPLPQSDARNYLIECASGAGLPDLFATEALDLIVNNALGSPRLLRSLASFAFFRAACDGASQIGIGHAESAFVAQNPSRPPKPFEHTNRIACENGTPAEQVAAIESPSGPETSTESIGGLVPEDSSPPKDERPVRSPSDIEKLAERISIQQIDETPAESVDALSSVDGALSKDENPANSPSYVEEHAEHIPRYETVETPVSVGGFVSEDSLPSKEEKPARSPTDIETLAERIWRHQIVETPAVNLHDARPSQTGARRIRWSTGKRRENSKYLEQWNASSALRRGTLVAAATLVVAAAAIGAVVPSLLPRAGSSSSAPSTIAAPPVQASVITPPVAPETPAIANDAKPSLAPLPVANDPQIIVAEIKNAAQESVGSKEEDTNPFGGRTALRGLTNEEKAAVARGIQELEKAATKVAPSDDRR